MDVILDSNIYISDLTLSKPWFLSLFDYLRRTNSDMVLLEPVREEIFGYFDRKIGEGWASVKAVNSKFESLGAQRPFPARRPRAGAETLKLGNRLMKPYRDITSKFYSEYLDFGVEDVVRRGARRIRPANEKGEELRDVIVWLMVLQYSTFEKKEVAFITNDSAFWESDSDVPHRQIAEDIANKKAAVKLFRGVAAFLSANMPTPVEVDTEWVTRNVEQPVLLDRIEAVAMAEAQRKLPLQWGRKVSQPRVQFMRGNLFGDNQQPKFAELEFEFATRLDATIPERRSTILRSLDDLLVQKLQPFIVNNSHLKAVLTGTAIVFARFSGRLVSIDVHKVSDVELVRLFEFSGWRRRGFPSLSQLEVSPPKET
jgi:hypothetical protein